MTRDRTGIPLKSLPPQRDPGEERMRELAAIRFTPQTSGNRRLTDEERQERRQRKKLRESMRALSGLAAKKINGLTKGNIESTR